MNVQKTLIKLLFLLLVLFAQNAASQTITTRFLKGIEPPSPEKFTTGKLKAETYEGCGFYDFRKKYYENVYNFCWLSSATNMLHWWLQNNKQYVDRFGYVAPQKYWNEDAITRSEIFDYFRAEGLENIAGNASMVTNRFLTGGIYRNVDFQGFFKQVFGKETELISAWDRERDNAWVSTDIKLYNAMKTCIENHRAMSLSYFWMGGNSHIITLWGADFDEENKRVTALYYTDSDDRYPGMGRYPINYKSRTWDDGSITWEAYIGENVELTTISALDFGTQQWEQYFADNTATEICNSLNNNTLPIYTLEKSIYIENAEGALSVYTLAGQQLYTTAAAQSRQQIEVPAAGFI